MGFGNFLKGAIAQINPFDNGKTYSTYNPPKKKNDFDTGMPTPSVEAPQQSPAQNRPISQPQAQRPDNLFQGLNQNLRIGQPNNSPPVFKTPIKPAPTPGTVVKPVVDPNSPQGAVERGLDAGKSWEQIAGENNLDVNSVKAYSQATRPNYGITVVKPQQSFGNKIRDVFDANTQADQYRRQEGNVGIPSPDQKPLILQNPGNIVTRTPVVGTAVKMLNTGATQLAELPATISGLALSKIQSNLTSQMIDAQRRGDTFAYNDAKDKLDALAPEIQKNNAQQAAGHSMFTTGHGGLANAGTLYSEQASKSGDVKTGVKDIGLPTVAAMLDLYTLGKGSAIGDAIGENGLTQGVRAAAPDIGKAAVGNFGSGVATTYNQGGNAQQAVKSGLINSLLGLIPDVGLPALTKGFTNRVMPAVFRGRPPSVSNVASELDDAGISASAEAANQALRPKPISVAQNIPVQAPEALPQAIRVRNMAQPKPLIQDVSGGAPVATPNPLIKKFAEDAQAETARNAAFDAAKTAGQPDQAIEGIKPPTPNEPYKLAETTVKTTQDKMIGDYADQLKQFGEGNGVDVNRVTNTRQSNNYRPGMGSGRVTKEQWREEAERQLRNGQAESGFQKAFDDAANPDVQSLINKGDQTADLPPGRPIAVKQAKGISVTDQTTVPTGLPEKPGTVRATTQASPMAAKTEAAAINPPVVGRPVQLPAETQAVLDNPKQFTSRQVTVARNQRKMARAVAKANEGTQEAVGRIETASPAATSDEGFQPTGAFGKSANGGSYQKVSRATEMQQAVQETSQMSPGDAIQTARKNQADTGSFNRRDIRNIMAMFENKRIPRGTPEFNEAKAILKEDGTVQAQSLALRGGNVIRRTATADQLTSQFESKIYRSVDDPTKIDSKAFDEVDAAEQKFTQARDDTTAAYNRFTEAPTSANAKAYHAAQDATDAAEKDAKMTEFKIAKKILKGNKDTKQVRELEKMAGDANLYQMDAVDASMLSGTGTFVRNFVNAGIGGSEEGLLGGVASRIARKLTGQEVGGGFGKGTLKGFREGSRNLVDASKARAANAGKNPLEHIKNFTTTGNELGDTIIDSQIKHNILDHYTQVLKSQGFKGRELTDRAGVMARQDPDSVGRAYAGAARAGAGLGGGITRGNKVETIVKNAISDGISLGHPGRVSENAAKLITRMTIGFPTAIGRSTAEGVKRFTLGAPTFIKALATKDPVQRALLVKDGIKQAGSGGLVLPPLFYAMGANGMITGAYPKGNPEEEARWKREGITENSIKIGGNYYQLPSYLGTVAIPSLFYASLGRNGGDIKAAAADTAKIIPAILPTDQASNVMDVINGNSGVGKFMAQSGASAVRAATPAGALLNQIAKSLDPTKNDTSSGTNWENFISKVESGIPGLSHKVPNQVDDAGNPIMNPKPAPLALGASSAEQGAGVQRTADLQGKVDTRTKSLSDTGVLGDSNLKGVLDDKNLQIYNKLNSGKQITDKELKSVQDALTKGVSPTGGDTAYLEREQYDSNLAALKLKRQIMSDDKTTKPSDIAKMDTAIKRGEVYKNGNIPYDMIQSYEGTSLTDWRAMGDPENDAYNPDMYQKLWDIDQTMTKAGVSYKTGDLTKQKYSAKQSKATGKGSRGGSAYSADFGKLKAGSFAPQVQQYQSMAQSSGSVPVINTVHPNIVHKISSGGGI